MSPKRAVAAGVVLAAGLFGLYSIRTPYAGFQNEVFVEIPKGANTVSISRLLAGAGVLRHGWEFLLVRLIHPRAKLLAGEYVFRKPASPEEVFGRIARGDVFFYPLTVPEGSNMFDIAAELERQDIMPAGDFLEAAHDPALIRDLDPRAPTLEGYLFPDTYRLSRHTTARQLCRQMVARFREVWRELGAPDSQVHEAVTLASLVEKEAKLGSERPLIASVFSNRLRIGMALQCDPTTIYAALLENRYRGAIHQSDLDSRQRYNTYQYPGLPPGPIANPGKAAIEAALHPAGTKFLYFVRRADDSGAHQFSEDLAQHARAVRKYRKAGQSGGRLRNH
jgi:UPF0755 protein